MSQHPFTIPNQLAPAARADINLALKALASTNSGASAPATTYANQLWYDEANDRLKIRNEANSDWITLGFVNQSTQKFEANFTPATAAEAITGAVNDKPVTPVSLVGAFLPLMNFFQPVGSEGITLSNGLIFKWGQGTVPAGLGANVRVNFASAFPSSFIVAHITVHGAAQQMMGVSGWDVAGFTVQKGNSDDAVRSFFWLSLGY